MTRPLRSPAVTAGSSLLRAGPPAHPATVLNPLRGHRLGHSLSPPTTRQQYRGAPSPVPHGSSRPGSRRLHAGHRLANKRAPARLILESTGNPSFDVTFDTYDTSATIRSRSPSRSPPDAITDAFSPSLTTKAFNQRSMRRFEASHRRATPKGHNLHLPYSTALNSPPTSDSPPRSGHTQ